VAIADMYREIQTLRRQVDLMRKCLVRLGKVSSVDVAECTVVVEFPLAAVHGEPSRSLPVPWLQRSTEHRPPAVGDHAVVIDPSLGYGAGVAITGWPSAAMPAPGATSKHVLYAGSENVRISSPNVELGVTPTDYAALASRCDAEFARIWNMFTTWAVAPTDGGGALKTLSTAAASGVQTVAATQVKVK